MLRGFKASSSMRLSMTGSGMLFPAARTAIPASEAWKRRGSWQRRSRTRFISRAKPRTLRAMAGRSMALSLPASARRGKSQKPLKHRGSSDLEELEAIEAPPDAPTRPRSFLSSGQHNHDFPKRFIGFQARVGFCDLSDGEDTIDIRTKRSAGEQRHNFGRKLLRDLDLFFQRAGTQHGAPDSEPFAEHVAGFQFVIAAGYGADEHHAGLLRHQLLACFHVGAADQVEHDIDAFARGPFLGGGLELVKVF